MKKKHFILLILYRKLGMHGMQYALGVKVRNMKMDFNTGGTWRQPLVSARAMNTDNEYL